jgi:glycosyltransferase involved in cell wall biosynthesis
LRIAVWHNLPSGGGKRALYYHVRGLVERGHTVEAWCPPTADKKYLPLRDFVREHVVPFTWTEWSARNRLGTVVERYRNITTKLAAMDEHNRICADQINQGRYDVVFANACTFFRTTSIARHSRVPTILYLGEPFRWLYEALPELPWVALPRASGRAGQQYRYVKTFIRNLVDVQALRVQMREELVSARAFSSILVNSHFSRESVLRAYGIAAKVCYLGVDAGLFITQQQPREGFVVGLGALIPEKRPEIAIEALSKLPDPRPELVWISNVSTESYAEHVLNFARARSVRLRLEIGIADKEVVNLLNRAAMLVYAPRLEPFGFAPLEANACGLPVVAVAEGGVRETVFHGVNGLVVEDDPGAMAGAIRSLLRDPSYAARLGEAGRRMVEREWSLSAAVDRLEQRLSEAIVARASLRS